MALAETANLITRLSLQDQLSPGLNKAQAQLGLFGRGATGAVGSVSLFQRATQGIQGALSTLGTRIGQVARLLGFAGLTGGLIGAVAFLRSAVEETRDFGKAVGQMATLTGLSVEQTSLLAAAFHHYGIDTDTALTITALAEKNLFRLGGTAQAAAAFQQKYGLSLVDSSGHLKDFNTLILDASDYFTNKHIPAAQRDAAMAAIFGRNWRALLPVLNAGSAALESVEQEAKRLGLTLSKDNLKALSDNREAMRLWGSAIGALKIQLGITLIPILTQVTSAFTRFLITQDKMGVTGSQKIVSFFQGMVRFGQAAVAVIGNQVVPVIQKVIAGWQRLPAPLQSLLIRGLTGNYAIKFLLGFDPIGLALGVATKAGATLASSIAGALGGSLLSKIFKGFGERGSSPANALWVRPVGGLGTKDGPLDLSDLVKKIPFIAGLGELTIAGAAGAAASIAALVLPLISPYVFQGPANAPGSLLDPTNTTLPGAGGGTRTGVVPAGTSRMFVGLIPGFPTLVSAVNGLKPPIQRTEASISRQAGLQSAAYQVANRQLAATNAARQITSADQARTRAAIIATERGAASQRARAQAALTRLGVTSLAGNGLTQRTNQALVRLQQVVGAQRPLISSISSRTASVAAAVRAGHAITGHGFQRTVDGVNRTTTAVRTKKMSFAATVNVRNNVVVSNTEMWTKLNSLRLSYGLGGSV